MKVHFAKGLFLVMLIIVISFSCIGYGICQTTLTYASGMAGGPWYERAGIFAELIKEKSDIDIKVVPGAGLANAAVCGRNEAQISISYAVTAASAIAGTDLFRDIGPLPDIRAIATGWGVTVSNFIVFQDTKIDSIDEVFTNKQALNWGVPQKGSLDEFIASKVLEYYGVTYDDLSKWGGKVIFGGYTDLVRFATDKQLDVLFSMSSHPTSWLVEANVSRPIRLLEYPEALKKYLYETVFFQPEVIPAGTYSGNYTGPGEVKDLVAAGIDTVLFVHKSVPDDVVYTITKILFENLDRLKKDIPQYRNLNVETSWKNTGAPLHTGAEKYYKEVGVMK